MAIFIFCIICIIIFIYTIIYMLWATQLHLVLHTVRRELANIERDLYIITFDDSNQVDDSVQFEESIASPSGGVVAQCEASDGAWLAPHSSSSGYSTVQL